MKNTRMSLVALLAVMILQVGVIQAQPDVPPTDGGPGCCPDSPDGDPNGGDPPGDPGPTAIPFDGGISLLLAAGAAYGVRRSARKRDVTGK
jgi:hypothetical protein